MKKGTIRLALAFGFGIAILLYLFWSMGFDNIVRVLSSVRPEYFLAAALIYLISELVAALNLKVAIDGKIRLRNILPSHMCGMLYSAVTPGRFGYYYTAFSLAKKTRESRSKNIGILTIMQGVTFFVKVISCIIAVIYFSRLFISTESKNYFIMAAFVPVLFVVSIVLILYTQIPNKVVARIPFLKKTLGYISMMQESRKSMNARKIASIISLNLIGWFIVGAQWYFLSRSLNLDLSYWDAFMLQPLLSAVMFIPLTPSGLGITEGGSALLFTLILSSMPSAQAKAAGVAYILLVRLNSIIVDSFGLIDMRIHGKK
jgi:hypothetical protein